VIGTRISHYEIVEKLGEGGMGVVYKAEDTRLDRPVALKFLPNHLLGDQEVRRRFEREAKASAALSHSNVCTVHEIDEADGKTFIAMELIEGESLDKKIENGPLKLEEALDIAQQIAKGLEAAHKKGVVHRDIKPQNIMVGDDGHVTIMDFGLAQLTQASLLTRPDQTMGTTFYMSPEQTEGSGTDHRTDIWSLGIVLHEMIAGQRPFKGDYDKAVMYSILNEDAEPLTAVRSGVPMKLEWLVNKCLAKQPSERYQRAAEMIVDLEAMSKKLESAIATQAVKAGGSIAGPLARYRVIEGMEEPDGTIKYVAEDVELEGPVAIRVLPQSSAEQIERVQRRKQNLLLGATAGPYFWACSPLSTLWLPRLRSLKLLCDASRYRPRGPQSVPLFHPTGGTSRIFQDPLVSASCGCTISIRTGHERSSSRELSTGECSGRPTVSFWVSGGALTTLVQSTGSRWSAWTPDGESLIFPLDDTLYSVSARGGKPDLWFKAADGDVPVIHPSFFPAAEGTGRLLGTENRDGTFYVIVLDRASGHRLTLASGFRPVYDSSGYVVYQSLEPEGIWAVPFSVDTMKPMGEAFPIAEGAETPSVALDGTMVYAERPIDSGLRRLVWRARNGSLLGTIGQPQDFLASPSLSPDGRRVAVSGADSAGAQRDVWIHDVDRPVKTNFTAGWATRRFTFPIWSPQGDQIAFYSQVTRSLDVQRADGSTESFRLLENVERYSHLSDWSPDEETLWSAYGK